MGGLQAIRTLALSSETSWEDFTLWPLSCPVHRTFVNTEVSRPQGTCTRAVLDISISAAPTRHTAPTTGGEKQKQQGISKCSSVKRISQEPASWRGQSGWTWNLQAAVLSKCPFSCREGPVYTHRFCSSYFGHSWFVSEAVKGCTPHFPDMSSWNGGHEGTTGGDETVLGKQVALSQGGSP